MSDKLRQQIRALERLAIMREILGPDVGIEEMLKIARYSVGDHVARPTVQHHPQVS